MDNRHQQRIVSILNILNEAGRPLGGIRIAGRLRDFGFDRAKGPFEIASGNRIETA